MDTGNPSSAANASLQIGRSGRETNVFDPISVNQTLVTNAFAKWNRRIEQAKADEKLTARRYWLNFGLLMAVVVLCWSYYLRHLEQLFTQAMFVGIPVTFWGAWQVLRDWAPSGPLAEDQGSLAQRILRDRWATQWLILAIVVVSLALSATASIYLTFENGAAQAVEIELLTGNQRLRENLTVSSSKPIQGGQYYFRADWFWQPVDLRLAAVKPFGYQLKSAESSRRLRSYTSIHLKFPDDFERMQYYVIRLVPGKGLQGINPAAVGSPASVYRLEILINGQKQGQIDASYDCIYFGASELAIQTLRDEEPNTVRVDLIKGLLSALSPPPNDVQSGSESLARSERVVTTPALHPGDHVKVIVYYETKEKGSVEYELKESGIQDLVIGIGP